MSERKNHLTIDGGQVQEDEHVASYKPIPESDAGGFRSSKASLHKSKEKVDEAEEKLLEKEDEAKIVTRVDMADAKYVVGDHRNGDAKIELDANKRQFSGLTKEELMQYADDPFWVRLRWAMFILFWALWLCMLAGAIAIIVQAPKCAPPPPRTWFEKGPLIDLNANADVDVELPPSSLAAGVFAKVACGDSAYAVLQTPDCVNDFKKLVERAKNGGIKVILELVANFVPNTHEWFKLSEGRSAGYEDYFIWGNPNGYDTATNDPKPPNDWVSVANGPAWTYSAARQQFYLHQLGEGTADLNFTNPAVVKRFDEVLTTWMKAGADGVRLANARLILVNSSLLPEQPAPASEARDAALSDYRFWRHRHSADTAGLDALLAHWSAVVDGSAAYPGAGESVFTLAETGNLTELFLLGRNLSGIRPPAAAPLSADGDLSAVASKLNARLPRWPALQLVTSEPGSEELGALALLLPAAPVLTMDQLVEANDTADTESLSRLVALRGDASIAHGNWTVAAVPAGAGRALAVARWKAGHTGYVAVWNPGPAWASADLSALPALPDTLTVHRVSPAVRLLTNYTSNMSVDSKSVSVSPAGTVVLSFVPVTTAEE